MILRICPCLSSCPKQVAVKLSCPRRPSRLAQCRQASLGRRPAQQHFRIHSSSQPDTTTSKPRPGYRENVGVCLVNRQGLVFAGRRPKSETPWQLPQGGIDQGESPADAAARELQEETGISQASIIGQADRWLDYDFPPGHRGWGNFPGQTQMWFLMLYHGDLSDINLNQHDPPEFDSFQWMELQALPSQVVPFKRAIYEELARQFTPIIERHRASPS